VEIDRAEVIVTSPGRNFVTLRLTTSDGVQGIGDATVNGRELAVASYLQDHLCPLLIGRDPQRIEDIWQYLYRGGYWRRGPVTMAAIAAVCGTSPIRFTIIEAPRTAVGPSGSPLTARRWFSN